MEENAIPYGQLIFNSMFAMTYYSASTDDQLWADDINCFNRLSKILNAVKTNGIPEHFIA